MKRIKFTENGAAIIIGDSLTITDVDDTNIDSAIIRISKNYDYIETSPSTGATINLGDSLFFAAGVPAGITAYYTYGANTGDSITLGGSATLANYKTALSKLTFKNNSDDPTNNDTKLSRTIEFLVRDNNSDNLGNQWSTVITRKLNIVPTADTAKLADTRTLEYRYTRRKNHNKRYIKNYIIILGRVYSCVSLKFYNIVYLYPGKYLY